MPVYEENLDNITGILYVKDLLQHLDEKEDFRWQTLIRPAYFVPETKKINDLLEEFQTKKVHLAIVVDEYGGTTGIVTMETLSKRSWATLMMNTTNRKLFTRGTRMGHTFSRPPRY